MKLVILMLIYLLMMLSGQVMWKKGVDQLPVFFNVSVTQTIWELLTSAYILFGLMIYGLATFLWLYLLSKHNLSYIYPMTSLSFVLAVIVSLVFLGEAVPVTRWFGVFVICAGVYLVSLE